MAFPLLGLLKFVRSATIACTLLLAFVAAFNLIAMPAAAAELSDAERLEIAVDAYIYAFPMVLMDVSKEVMTNVEAANASPSGGGGAPVNQFVHMSAFPNASFTDVVRPNADTLYSMMWFDVSQEPLVVKVPDSEGRYYLLQMLDMWSDIFSVPGKRTTGTGPQTFAIVGPTWTGELPAGVTEYRSPTAFGWIIGRTQTNGVKDIPNVQKFQQGIVAAPLSAWGKPYMAPKGKVDASISKQPPIDQTLAMDAANYFTRFAELMKTNPPHSNDYPILGRLARIGIVPGQSFDAANAPTEVQEALAKAIPIAKQKILNELERSPRFVNQWGMIGAPVGTYGTAYLNRAGIAFFGLGANSPEDAVYPTARVDSDGKPFDSDQKYQIHFEKEGIPPANAFWSLTMYNDRQFFTANPINRYAIGDRDALKFNDDGSLDLYVQRESPGPEKESNWLPAPAEGGFSMNLRLYWPKPSALDGAWKPAPVKRVE